MKELNNRACMTTEHQNQKLKSALILQFIYCSVHLDFNEYTGNGKLFSIILQD